MAGEDDAGGIAGSPIDDAVESIIEETDASDSAIVRSVLESVAEDGVVSLNGVSSALADASMVVATAETRAEVAADRLTSARETAASTPDLTVIESRLDSFESRLEEVESAVDDLGDHLDNIVTRADDPTAIYHVAREIRRVSAEASDAQGAADELIVDLDDFQRWLSDAEVRYRDLKEDVDAIQASIEELSGSIDAVDDDEMNRAAWIEMKLQTAVSELLLEDARTELLDLTSWDDRPEAETIGHRLDDLRDQLSDTDDRLEKLARPGWTEDERLATVAARLETFEPPVEWGEVRRVLEEYRSSVGEEV